MSDGSASTRDRLVRAALELVAERGFDGARVGDIEVAAGLAPRSGALYQYFDSKIDVVRAGLDAHLRAVEEMASTLESTPLEQLLPSAGDIARWLLEELDRERVVTQVIEREGGRLPELRDRMRIGISDRGYRTVSTLLTRWVERLARVTDDHEAVAVLLVGSLINVRRSMWTFGAPPLGVTDDRIVAAFEALITVIVRDSTAEVVR
jgi:AcrR family transcriptional regulator